MCGTVSKRADRLLPFEFTYIAAPWKTQEIRMEIRQLLHQILPVSVWAVLPRGRKERNQIYPDRTRIGRRQYEVGARCWRDPGRRHQLHFVAAPLARR